MIGKKILEALQKKGISQYRAAKELGIGAPRLNQYIKDERYPDHDMILRLCHFLDITPNYLFDIPEKPALQKEILTEFFIAVENWLQKNKLTMEVTDKIELVFALYDYLAPLPAEQRTAQIINLTSLLYKNKKVS